MTVQRSVTGTEAACDDIVALVDKALGYPKSGTHVGGGRHVDMPATWDGTGDTPPGWTRSHTRVWVANANDAAVPLTDADVTALNRAGAQARLTAAERARLSAALAARQDVEIEGRTPKARAAVEAAEEKRP